MDRPDSSSQHSPDDVELVMHALRTYAGSVDGYLDAMRNQHHVNRVDLNALAVVMDHASRCDPVTPTGLGSAIHLSTSATSSMLDRLERSGHVVRRRHPDDRRSVIIEVTPLTMRMGYEVFGRLGQAAAAVMEAYTSDELHLIARFLDEVSAASARASTSDLEA